ncbi:MAG: hypothetical protein JRJ84_12965 [Deltaproteobacteria bacterium]|nr:hypothetical protein [Deltaproteobacteria bacterium]
MNEDGDGLPILAHQAGEFYAWLWWASETRQGVFDLGGETGRVEVWVDDRLAFRNPHEQRVSATVTGPDAPDTPEARAALAGGKILQELGLHVRRDDRDFSFVLKGPAMDLVRAKLPPGASEGEDAVYERMFLYEEVSFLVGALLREYARDRTSEGWESETLPAIRRWVLARG